MPESPRAILVVCTRRIGDVLLVTALIRTLRKAYPEAAIDALVHRGTTMALEGNPDIRECLAIPERAGWTESWPLLRRIFRRYDLGVCTLTSDRPHLMTWLAARRRVGILPPPGAPGAGWKRWLLQASTPLETHVTHMALQYLRLAECLGIERHWALVPPRPRDTRALESVLGPDWAEGRYAVLHPSPMYRYKAWTLDGWRGLVRWLAARGLRVVITGGPAEAERAYARQILDGLGPAEAPAVEVCGRLSFAALTPLIEHAAVFVGPDTSVTHLAAATGRPTVALFGPSSPVTWGPWPRGFDEDLASPWVMTAPLQHRGNVWILQGITHCVPCLQEGCEHRWNSRADCLDQLPLDRVTSVVEQALGMTALATDRAP